MHKFVCAGLAAITILTACKSDKVYLVYDVIGNSGETIGTLTLSEDTKGVQVIVSAAGITPGEHGIHLHHTGDCATPDFKSAGGHINPMKKAHGLQNQDGPDNADMPNAVADADGNVAFEYVNNRVSLRGKNSLPALLDDNGSALVMHENPDDGITQPIGGAGPRIACAEIR